MLLSWATLALYFVLGINDDNEEFQPMFANPDATERFGEESVHAIINPVASSSGTVEQLSVFGQPTGPTKTLRSMITAPRNDPTMLGVTSSQVDIQFSID